jgi:hypothetical protein
MDGIKCQFIFPDSYKVLIPDLSGEKYFFILVMKNWSALQATGATPYAAISWYFFLFFIFAYHL